MTKGMMGMMAQHQSSRVMVFYKNPQGEMVCRKITLDSEISINFRFKKKATIPEKHKHNKNSSRFGKTTFFCRWWIANVSC